MDWRTHNCPRCGLEEPCRVEESQHICSYCGYVWITTRVFCGNCGD